MKIDQSLEGKRVRIRNVDGNIFEGVLEDYIYPEDNEPEGVAGLDISDCPQMPEKWIGFNENEIEDIEILD